VKPDMRRLLGAGVSLALHVCVLMLWRHAADAAGLVATDAGQETGVDVQVVAAAPGVARIPSTAPKPEYGEQQSAKPFQAGVAAEQTAYRLPAPAYYGPLEVDKDALPYSAPDPDLLADVAVSGLPIRIRLYIDASGVVTGVDTLQALADDQQALERIERMLRSTRFMPARLGGTDVNSYQDLEFHIGPELNNSPG
jgi:hypothetical protein